MNKELRELNQSTEEDMLFGIGVIELPGCKPAPYLHIHYGDWSREKLDIVRESFRGSLVLTSARRVDGTYDLRIATSKRITLGVNRGNHEDVLRAPAWDAQLADVEDQVFRLFEINRKRHGGFLLVVQTPEWEFLTVVDDRGDEAVVGAMLASGLCPCPAS